MNPSSDTTVGTDAESTAIGTCDSITAASSSGNPNSISTTGATSHRLGTHSSVAPLSYPHNFFDPKTGQGPKNQEEAKRLWPYRKDRPASSSVDTVPADGAKMMLEVKAMKDRLKNHIESSFMKEARHMASVWNLQNPTTNMAPVTFKDFLSAFSALKRVEGSLDSERTVYMVCHHFHHPREWLSNTVDEWCKNENIHIDIPRLEKFGNEGVRQRESKHYRGGFGVYARAVKSEMVKKWMRNMLNKAGWCIATKDNSKQGQGKKYQPVTIRIEQTSTQHTCFVVTSEDASDKKPAAKKVAGGLAAEGSSAERPLDVEALQAFGAHVANVLGQSLSPQRMEELYHTYQQNEHARTDGVIPAEIDVPQDDTPGGILSDITTNEVPQPPHPPNVPPPAHGVPAARSEWVAPPVPQASTTAAQPPQASTTAAQPPHPPPRTTETTATTLPTDARAPASTTAAHPPKVPALPTPAAPVSISVAQSTSQTAMARI